MLWFITILYSDRANFITIQKKIELNINIKVHINIKKIIFMFIFSTIVDKSAL